MVIVAKNFIGLISTGKVADICIPLFSTPKPDHLIPKDFLKKGIDLILQCTPPQFYEFSYN